MDLNGTLYTIGIVKGLGLRPSDVSRSARGCGVQSAKNSIVPRRPERSRESSSRVETSEDNSRSVAFIEVFELCRSRLNLSLVLRLFGDSLFKA